MVALAPRSVATDLPKGLVTVQLADATEPLETHLLWRDPMTPAVEACRATARGVYAAG